MHMFVSSAGFPVSWLVPRLRHEVEDVVSLQTSSSGLGNEGTVLSIVSSAEFDEANSGNLFFTQVETGRKVVSWLFVQPDIAACVVLDFDSESQEPAPLSERCSRHDTGEGNFTITLLLSSPSFFSSVIRLRGGKNFDWSLP